MTHLDEGRLLALRDDPGAASEEDARHAQACPACRQALEVVRRQAGAVAAAIAALDAGAGDLERVREAVRLRVAARGAEAAGDALALPARAPRRAFWSLSRAAGILLVTAAGASALPGSPVRAWIERLAASGGGEAAAPLPASTPERAAAGAAAAAAPEEAGVRLSLAGGPLAVVLRGAVPGTEIRVTWVPGDEAALFAPAGSRFTSGEGRLEAVLAPGPVRVELHRRTVPLSLEVNGTVLLRSTPQGIEATGSVLERSEAGITFIVGPR